MVDFTILELHIEGLDASELPFGREKSTTTGSKGKSMFSSADRGGGEISGSDSGIRDRLPLGLIIGVVVFAIGAVVVTKLLGRDAVGDMAEEF